MLELLVKIEIKSIGRFKGELSDDDFYTNQAIDETSTYLAESVFEDDDDFEPFYTTKLSHLLNKFGTVRIECINRTLSPSDS